MVLLLRTTGLDKKKKKKERDIKQIKQQRKGKRTSAVAKDIMWNLGEKKKKTQINLFAE